MNIKKPFIHHARTHVSTTNGAWLKIVYIGFVLFALSIIFHAWLFISSGEIGTISSTGDSTPMVTINRTKLDSVLSDYVDRQSERVSQAHIDAVLKDPSK